MCTAWETPWLERLSAGRPRSERGEGIIGSLSVTSSLNVGSYAGRLDNLNLAGVNNPSPNLTTVYLDTPLVGPTPEPLEYIP